MTSHLTTCYQPQPEPRSSAFTKHTPSPRIVIATIYYSTLPLIKTSQPAQPPHPRLYSPRNLPYQSHPPRSMLKLTPVPSGAPLPSQCWVQKPADGMPQDPTCYTAIWQSTPLTSFQLILIAILPSILFALFPLLFMHNADAARRRRLIRASCYGAIGWMLGAGVPILMKDAEARGMKRVGWLSPNVVSYLGVMVHTGGFAILQWLRSRNRPCEGCGKYKKGRESFCDDCQVEKPSLAIPEVQENGKACEEKRQLLDAA